MTNTDSEYEGQAEGINTWTEGTNTDSADEMVRELRRLGSGRFAIGDFASLLEAATLLESQGREIEELRAEVADARERATFNARLADQRFREWGDQGREIERRDDALEYQSARIAELEAEVEHQGREIAEWRDGCIERDRMLEKRSRLLLATEDKFEATKQAAGERISELEAEVEHQGREIERLRDVEARWRERVRAARENLPQFGRSDLAATWTLEACADELHAALTDTPPQEETK
jgi:uncharacterized coiled-coil protein SlyX